MNGLLEFGICTVLRNIIIHIRTVSGSAVWRNVEDGDVPNAGVEVVVADNVKSENTISIFTNTYSISPLII